MNALLAADPLIDTIDSTVRHYARRLHPEMGEDAYHSAVCDILAREQAPRIQNPSAFFQHATRLALYRMFRHRRADMVQTYRYLMGDPPPGAGNLALGRLPITHCRQGHPMTEDNLTYIGPRRTCLTCRRTNQAACQRARTKRRRDAMTRPLIALIALLCGFGGGVDLAQSCQLSWIAPTVRTDGAALTDLVAFRLYDAQVSGQYGTIPKKQTGPETQTDCGPEGDGQRHYFTVTAVRATGAESERSAEVNLLFAQATTVAPLLPGPTGVTFNALTRVFSYSPNLQAQATRLYVHEAGTPYDCNTQTYCGPVTGGTATVATMKWATNYDCWMSSVNADGKEGEGSGVACSIPVQPLPPPPPPPPADQDADGIPDTLDKCPTVKGVAPDGCPAPIPAPVDVFRNVINSGKTIKFDYRPSACPAGAPTKTTSGLKANGDRTITITCK